MFKALLEPFRHPKLVLEPAGAADGGRKPKAKPKNWSATLARIWSYLAKRKAKLALVLLLVLFSTGLALLGPYLISRAVDHYLEGDGGRSWVIFLITLALVYLFTSLSTWLQNIWMIEIAQETVFRMRTDLFAYLHRLPISFFNRRQQGEIMSRLTNDIENISSTLNSSAIQIFSSVLTLAGTVGVMLWLSPLLTLLTFIVVPLMFLGMRWITRRTGPLFKERQRNVGEMNGYIEETLSGQRVIKAFSQEERVISGFRERNTRIMLSGYWAQAISGFIPKLMNGLNNLSFAIVAGIGGLLAIRDIVTVGIIIAFVEYTRQFTRPLNDLANQWNTLLSAIAGAERVFEVMDEETEARDEGAAVSLNHVEGAVSFRDVSFSYDEGNDILHNISFEAKPGEMIALVGPTGAGKTTLIGLLSRFYDPSSGNITLDGRDLSSIRRESLRSQMAFVLQDTFLFKGTIRDNIRYGRLDATDAEVEEAAKLANAHSFIMRMRGGYDRMLSVDGSGISQGQKQLLAIARAILADPAMLVLDEATSSIDTVTEIKIQEGLQTLMKGRTSFVIAHRLGTIRAADRILVLQNGRLLQQGSHDELLRQGGLYSELVHGARKAAPGGA
ncbi:MULTISPECIES: ABC transporter ATP-binding protein [unclassified Paenibacillus]|uniref:ABC transporter ATP-binding protein n=1 Tax=unclassified Paenibacillus TaxID=185978 RepID=UPI002405D1F3|nr:MULTISPECIES: ABC transporter ATP-binding protein [unclassified Paenibacillus]MDF9840452.1 ATP-binding cassette subfamily B multidrug efflux pump [Paenibacillus sp. PastF-2]MDF9847034.1 ATP-binding cassette subfamily B multidrug efflux pump [Paenibacillus sp. PastM-2]MDF9853606.1 ATP-binding cassette subfamily B multidrug efflux pump [Paenibacillus sp. PastF-1]MDH6478908.1 ATP-binding cassette subfamily B multidrug efflux pump [Paenibacillus sp. PastH-2]MDH6506640.1 ATP-binding cassette sub